MWKFRRLDPLYPIFYLDDIVLKIRNNQRVINKSIYLALCIDIEGHKQLLGLWLAETESAKCWLSVLTELKNHILIADVLLKAKEAVEPGELDPPIEQ